MRLLDVIRRAVLRYGVKLLRNPLNFFFLINGRRKYIDFIEKYLVGKKLVNHLKVMVWLWIYVPYELRRDILFIAETIRDKQKREFETTFLDNLEKKIRKTKTRAIRWLFVEGMLGTCGLFYLAAICHKKSIEQVLNETNGDLALIRIGALIELRQRQELVCESRSILQSAKFKKLDKHLKESLEIFGKVEEKIELMNDNKDVGDYFAAKKLCLVGPAYNVNEDYLLDKCIIRISDFANKHNCEKGDISTKVVFYNGRDVEQVNRGEKNISGEFDFIYAKHKLVENHKNCIQIKMSDDFFIDGTMNMLQIILFEMNKYRNFDSLQIYGMNLYCGNMYIDDHPHKEVHTVGVNQWWSFTAHNIFMQFDIVKFFWTIGLFVPDVELKRVLEMDTLEYAYRIQQLY